MKGPERIVAGREGGKASCRGSAYGDIAAPEPWVYRERTMALLHRYFRMSIEVGRLPSILGREFFRAKVSHYRAQTFEDAVVFVLDVERCLEKLDKLSQRLIAYVVFQDYSVAETARRLHCNERTVRRRYPEALDQVTELFRARGILETLEPPAPGRHRICAQAESRAPRAAEREVPAGLESTFVIRAMVAAQACQDPAEVIVAQGD